MQDLVRSRREELQIGLGTYARLGAFPLWRIADRTGNLCKTWCVPVVKNCR